MIKIYRLEAEDEKENPLNTHHLYQGLRGVVVIKCCRHVYLHVYRSIVQIKKRTWTVRKTMYIKTIHIKVTDIVHLLTILVTRSD